MSGWQLARRIALTVLAVALGVPVLVFGAAQVGLEPTHWSGARLSGPALPFHPPRSAPEKANALLSQARDQDERDEGDLAPSYWDADADLVVLGAVTNAGVQLRDTLGRSSGTRYEVRRRATSSRDLRQGMDRVTFNAVDGLVESGVDEPGDRLEWTVTRLGHCTMASAAGYEVPVAVRLDPFAAPVTTMELVLGQPDPPKRPSQWSRADPMGTWFTLLTGFPWYLGTVLLLAAAVWIRLLRRSRGTARTAGRPRQVRTAA
jgi:hypothetical protein